MNSVNGRHDAGFLSEVATLAYSFAEARDFAPGHELDDWLRAEAQLLAARAPIPASACEAIDPEGTPLQAAPGAPASESEPPLPAYNPTVVPPGAAAAVSNDASEAMAQVASGSGHRARAAEADAVFRAGLVTLVVLGLTFVWPLSGHVALARTIRAAAGLAIAAQVASLAFARPRRQTPR
jgi:hypothetical protein